MVAPYLVLKWIHVLAAAYLVGSFVTEWALRAWAKRSPERANRTFVWDFHVKGEEMVAIPFALLLLASGLLMVFGPWRGGWSITRDLWVAGGLSIFVVVLIVMVVFATGSAKAAHAAYANGGGEAEAAPHEKRFNILSAVAGALVVGAVFLMVVKPF